MSREIDALRERADMIQTKLVGHRHNASPGQVEIPTSDFDAMYLLILELREKLGV